MALKDSLSTVKSEETPDYRIKPDNSQIVELVKELRTNLEDNQKLMEILKGYVSTQMDRDTDMKMATKRELSNLQKTSQGVQQGMMTLLQKQENLLNDHKGMMKRLMESGKAEMTENNGKTVIQLQQIESGLNGRFDEVKSNMQSEIKSMTEKANANLNDLNRRTSGMISNARKNIFLNDWLDVAKYGLGTAVFVVPIYIGIKYLFSVLGIQMP